MKNKIEQAFDSLTADKTLKDNTQASVIQFMREQNEKEVVKRRRMKRATGLTLVFTLLFAFVGAFIYQQPVSAVSIDSTNSIEVHFNRFNRVVDIIKYDENGTLITEEVDIEHHNFDAVIEEILNDSEAEEIYITIASQNEETTSKMISNLNHHQEMMKNIQVFASTEEVMNKARESHIPMGRMHAMHQLQEYDGDYSENNLEKESTKELMENFKIHHQEMMEGGGMHNHHNQKNHNGHMRHGR